MSVFGTLPDDSKVKFKEERNSEHPEFVKASVPSWDQTNDSAGATATRQRRKESEAAAEKRKSSLSISTSGMSKDESGESEWETGSDVESGQRKSSSGRSSRKSSSNINGAPKRASVAKGADDGNDSSDGSSASRLKVRQKSSRTSRRKGSDAGSDAGSDTGSVRSNRSAGARASSRGSGKGGGGGGGSDAGSVSGTQAGDRRRRRRTKSGSQSKDGSVRASRGARSSSRKSAASEDSDVGDAFDGASSRKGKRNIREPRKGRGIFDDDDDENDNGAETKDGGRQYGKRRGRDEATDLAKQQELQKRLIGKGGPSSAVLNGGGGRFRWSKAKILTAKERERLLKKREAIVEKRRTVYGLVTDEKLEHWAAKVLCKGMRTIIKIQRAKRAALHQQSLDLEHLQDFWSIITSKKGLVVYKQRRLGGAPVKRTLWVDDGMWRIMVGSERTIDLVFENTASREASYQLFDLLVKSVHEKAKQKQLSQYRNALVVKKRNKYSDFMAAIKMSRALMSQAGVRVNLVLPHGLKEPRNLRLLHGGRLVPTTLSFEEVDDLVFKAKRNGTKPPLRPVSTLARWLGPNPTHTYHKERAALPRSKMSHVLHSSNTSARVRGTSEFVDPNATAGTEEGLFMRDLVDCRAGMFSPAFADLIFGMKNAIKYAGMAKTAMVEQERLTVTLIGAERTFSLEFPSQRERDFFYVGMVALMDRCKHEDEQVAEALVGRPTRTVRHNVTEHVGGSSDAYGSTSLRQKLSHPKSSFNISGSVLEGAQGGYGPVATLDEGDAAASSSAAFKPSAAGILRSKGNVEEASRMALLGDDDEDDDKFVLAAPPDWDAPPEPPTGELMNASASKGKSQNNAPQLNPNGLLGGEAEATL